MSSYVEADYLVVGAGATAMAFTDALIDHADVRVVMVDRRNGVGGHWRDAYPFVRLHQSSTFYGVASTLLGGGRIQQDGPEEGLHERATADEICDYYDRVLNERFLASGQVTFLPGCDYLGDGQVVSMESGERTVVRGRRGPTRVVDARYLSPRIPSQVPAPYEVGNGVRAILVNDLVTVDDGPSQFVIVGSGKTATDACVWLLGTGVDPDAICWVRPREPWMLNRAVIQPDPVVFLGAAAHIMETAAAASSTDDWFLRLERAGVMLRIDRTLTPTMAKAPTLGTWELDLLRTIGDVVRLGHLRRVEPGRLVLEGGEVAVARDSVIVHCAADGLRDAPLVPIWGPEAITLQPIRTGFPCFGAALTGYAEATIESDEAKNLWCPPSPYASTPTGWARQQLLGARGSMAFGANPDLKAWTDGLAMNPTRIPPERRGSADLAAAASRFQRSLEPGLAALALLAG